VHNVVCAVLCAQYCVHCAVCTVLCAQYVHSVVCTMLCAQCTVLCCAVLCTVLHSVVHGIHNGECTMHSMRSTPVHSMVVCVQPRATVWQHAHACICTRACTLCVQVYASPGAAAPLGPALSPRRRAATFTARSSCAVKVTHMLYAYAICICYMHMHVHRRAQACRRPCAVARGMLGHACEWRATCMHAYAHAACVMQLQLHAPRAALEFLRCRSVLGHLLCTTCICSVRDAAPAAAPAACPAAFLHAAAAFLRKEPPAAALKITL
jgi:hypothetical protein